MNHIDKHEPNSLNAVSLAANNEAGQWRKRLLIVVGISLAIIAAILTWAFIRFGTLQDSAKKEREMIEEVARKSIRQTHKNHLMLLAKPFVWAIRTEMLKNNISQVNLYTNEMIKEKSFQYIVVANAQGRIVSSTNKKFEGQDWAVIGDKSALASDSTIVLDGANNQFIVSSPIMGFNNRLGTLLFVYSVPPIAFSNVSPIQDGQ